MKPDLNQPELEQLMKDFHLLTGIRIVLFDNEYHELLAWPASDCAFCQQMKARPETRHRCQQSDRRSFRACQRENRLIIYHCHAGLIEAAAPLIDRHAIVGYLMFGQISDLAEADELCAMLAAALPAGSDAAALAAAIPRRTGEQIAAAAKIMEACTFYVILKNAIRPHGASFIRQIDSVLRPHLAEKLDVPRIARELGISKSKLYQYCEAWLGCGIARYLHRLRLEQAQKLLKETAWPITRVASESGFADYNYFCRVFKKETVISARKYRSGS